ncbi:MAG: hypothetical protein MUD08_02430, partial [Cytophagales bacterium]|nr:hypothetical protein [Cytophagales bacterium]
MRTTHTNTASVPVRPTSVLSRNSAVVYLSLVLFCIVTLFVGQHLAGKGTPNLRLFSWDGVGLVAAGFIGIWLAPRTGFADLLDWRVSSWQRFGQPFIVGLGFAVADVAVYKLVIHPEPITALTPFMQPFPYSVLLFGSGALYTDCLYRLIPMPVLMWLIGGFLLK